LNNFIYKTKDLGLLSTFNSDEIISSIDVFGCNKNEEYFVQFLRETCAKIINVKLKSNEVITYTADMLQGVIDNKNEYIDTIFFLVGDFNISDSTMQIINSLIENCQVKVIIKKVSFINISTDGQYNYQSRRDFKSSWVVGVVSDNHDLYVEHTLDAENLADFHMVVPKTARKIDRSITIDIQRQMQTDSKRYLSSVNGIINTENNSSLTNEIQNTKIVLCNGMVSVYG